MILLLLPLSVSLGHAESSPHYFTNLKNSLGQLIAPKPTRSAHTIDITSLGHYSLDTSKVAELPQITRPQSGQSALSSTSTAGIPKTMNLVEAVHRAVQRRPEITQSISTLSAQAANIDVARAGYYPQLSGGIGTGDLTSGERGQQMVSLNATQMLYDFGKIKTNVSVEEARLAEEQAKVLVSLDQIAFEVADAIVSIKRYQQITQIAQQQIQGIGRIAEVANLHARAGISSQADPIQAQSNLEAAQSNLIVQRTQLRQYQQRLCTLLGFDVSIVEWDTPYPTISLKGSLSQAMNGRNPNNNEDDGFCNSVMTEVSSNLYRGGATRSQTRAASYAEEAARAQVNTVYLDVLDQVRLIREQIENKQKQMGVLSQRRATTVRTKELYQEQYKLGTRTVVDLLNAEQAIHSAAQEIESARYDIYSAIVQYIQVTGRTRDIYALNRISIQGFEVQP
ncbi:TolC family protein [Acinetobacter lwoffii]|uniref:TolC family protein n=1 Tax=Acinetobacter lwoffii TaxID=28090 RepID=UPI003F8D116B